MKVAKFVFSRDFDWSARPANCVLCQMVTWAYRAGHRLLVPEAAAAAAEAAGAGTRLAEDAELDTDVLQGVEPAEEAPQ